MKAQNVEEHANPSDKEIIYVTGAIGGVKKNILITAKGSGDAFNKEIGLAASSPCDIGMASRPIKDTEKNDLENKYRGWTVKRGPGAGEGTEHIIAMDGIAVIVHPSNPIKKLTVDTLRRIYSKQITDWKDVNTDTNHGMSGEIHLYCRAKPSGTRDFFIERVKPTDKINEAVQIVSSGDMASKVAGDQLGIGFVSESYTYSGFVKALDISNADSLEAAISCSKDQIIAEQYYLSRPLFLYTAEKPQHEETVRQFIRFALKEETQRNVVSTAPASLISVDETRYAPFGNNGGQGRIASANVILRINGSDTIGEKLAILLAKRFLIEKGARSEEIRETSATESDPAGVVTLITLSAPIEGKPATIEIRHLKSGYGFDSLADDKCDIAMSSDAISPRNAIRLQQAGFSGMDRPNAQFSIGYDAIAIIVNQQNEVHSLSLSQLGAIFTAKITNWRQAGGPDRPITVYSRPDGSGTRQFFTKKVLNNESLAANAIIRDHNSQIVSAVAADPGAIAYVTAADSQGSALLAVGDAADQRYLPNTLTIVTQKLYPITRTLYLYIPCSEADLKPSQQARYGDAKRFARMAQNLDKGGVAVKEAGFFPMIDPPPTPDLKKPTLLTTVQFDFNSAYLDADSHNKINNSLMQFIADHPEWQTMQYSVTGFSDIIGPIQACEAKALQRARIAAGYLAQQGLRVTNVKSGGQSNRGQVVLRPDTSKELLREDRRAEIWITR